MYHSRALLWIGFLLLGVPSDWKTLAEECIDLKVHASRVAICCQHEPFLEPATLDGCFKTADAENPDKDINFVVCAFDCAYRKMGFLSGTDEIDVETINTYHTVYDDTYRGTIANAVNHCVGTKDDIRQQAEQVPTTCSSFAVKFHACVVMQVVLNCPAERWNDSTICEKVKAGTPICKA